MLLMAETWGRVAKIQGPFRRSSFESAPPLVESLRFFASGLTNGPWLSVASLPSADLVNADKLAGRTRKYKVIFSPQKVSGPWCVWDKVEQHGQLGWGKRPTAVFPSKRITGD